jgi:hypothetical protein
MLNIISYGTENYEYQARVLYKSLLNRCDQEFRFHYYSVGYDSKWIEHNLVLHRIDVENKSIRPNFYKSMVLLKSLIDIEGEDYMYLDLDNILTPRFDSEFLLELNSNSHTPLAPIFYWEILDHGDRSWGNRLCEELGIERCGHHVNNSLITYSKRHFGFLLDWCYYTMDERYRNLVYGDEELFNVMLWKYKQDRNLGACSVSTFCLKEDMLYYMQRLSDNTFDVSMFSDNNKYTRQFDPKLLMLFHGSKEPQPLQEYLDRK